MTDMIKTRVLPIVLAAMISGCAAPKDLTVIGGSMTALGPSPAFVEKLTSGETPDGWIVDGADIDDVFSLSDAKGLPVLMVKPSAQKFSAVRQTRASLLASPYLKWTWQAEPSAKDRHPIRLIVGLADRNAPRDNGWWSFSKKTLLGVSRIISISWGRSALNRGTLRGPIRREDRPEVVVYIHRGGQEQSRYWWSDTVDLSLIHQQVWPNDIPSNMEVRFIGFAGHAAKEQTAMKFANVQLTR